MIISMVSISKKRKHKRILTPQFCAPWEPNWIMASMRQLMQIYASEMRAELQSRVCCLAIRLSSGVSSPLSLLLCCATCAMCATHTCYTWAMCFSCALPIFAERHWVYNFSHFWMCTSLCVFSLLLCSILCMACVCVFVLCFLFSIAWSVCKPSVWVWRVCELQTDGVVQETLPVISQQRDKRTAEDK